MFTRFSVPSSVLVMIVAIPLHASVLYVDDDAALGGDGLTWQTAYDDLQLALDAAKVPGSGVTEIRIAAGTYRPTRQSQPGVARTEAFQLINGVTLCGGYRGCPGGDCTSGDPNDWDVDEFETILSADLNGDDESGDWPLGATRSDNAFHVVFHWGGIPLDSTAVLKGCTMMGGQAYGSGVTSVNTRGGGVFCDGGSPTIEDCRFIENVAYEGGAVYFNDSSVGFAGCEFARNWAFDCGGGLCFYGGSPTITDSTISLNTASASYAGGGGIHCTGADLSILGTTITHNAVVGLAASGGGVMLLGSADMTLDACTIGHNSATFDGGGVCCLEGNLRITSSTIEHNFTEENGGGLLFAGGDMVVAHSRIIGNTAGFYGGGVFDDGSGTGQLVGNVIADNTARTGGGITCSHYRDHLTIFRCTITGNHADSLGGVDCCDASAWICNSILWGNEPDELPYGAEECVVSYSDVEGGWEGESNINVDPGFALPGDYHLAEDSPCVDAGTSMIIVGGFLEDMDGNPLSLDGDGDSVIVSDMGAFEFNPDFPTIAISDALVEVRAGEGGVPPEDRTIQVRNAGGGSLAWQIEEDCPWLEVSPATGTSTGEIDDITLSFATTGLSRGLYETDLIVSAPGAVNSPRALHVVLRVYRVLHVPAEYATIQAAIDETDEGDTVWVADGVYTGPGNRNLEFFGKSITVCSANGPESCIINCEYAGCGFRFRGGEDSEAVVAGLTIVHGSHSGIQCHERSSPTIQDCVISDNTGCSGGGIFSSFDCSPTIERCHILHNYADGWYPSENGGGGVYLAGPAVLRDCEISENDCFGTGGGVFCFGADCLIAGCHIHGNDAWGSGGGVGCVYSDAQITETIISGNTTHATLQGGGGVSFYGELGMGGMRPLMRDCTITGNAILTQDDGAVAGGGISCRNQGAPRISYCVIAGNRILVEDYPDYALGYGGGVDISDSCEPVFSHCVISANRAYLGGGIRCASLSSLTLENSLVAGNVGAGVLVSTSSTDHTIVGCTFTGNGPSDGEMTGYGVYCHLGSAGTMTMTNNILWGNEPSELRAQSGTVSVTYSDIAGGWAGEGNIGANPFFVDPDGLDDNPATWDDNDYRLMARSPCVDAGSNLAVPSDEGDLDNDGDVDERIPFDLSGFARFMDAPLTPDTGLADPPAYAAIVDMGAHEFQALPNDCNGNGIPDDEDVASGYSNDCDDNGIPDECELFGDLNNDGSVDYDDYTIFLAAFGGVVDGVPPEDVCCDADDSGDIGMADFAAWLACYRDFVGDQLADPPTAPTDPADEGFSGRKKGDTRTDRKAHRLRSGAGDVTGVEATRAPVIGLTGTRRR